MTRSKEKADAPAKDTAQKNIILVKAYNSLSAEAREKAIKRIAKRRAYMPKIYRANYDKAMSGKSLKAATKAFCLECVQWQREEVRLCTSTPCPLWPYRCYRDTRQNSSKLPPERPVYSVESTNAESKGD